MVTCDLLIGRRAYRTGMHVKLSVATIIMLMYIAAYNSIAMFVYTYIRSFALSVYRGKS